MSGSGSSYSGSYPGGTGGFGGGSGGGGDCGDLKLDAYIASPTADAMTLKEGDVLELCLETYGINALILVKYNNVTMGGIASPIITQLRQCMENGQKYGAKVLFVQGGQILISIYSIGV